MKQPLVFKEYLDKVCGCVQERSLWATLRDELQDHLELSSARLLQQGVPLEEAQRRAVQQLGDPLVLGKELASSYRPSHDWRCWGLLLCSVGLGLLLAFYGVRRAAPAFEGMIPRPSPSLRVFVSNGIACVLDLLLSFALSHINYAHVLRHAGGLAAALGCLMGCGAFLYCFSQGRGDTFALWYAAVALFVLDILAFQIRAFKMKVCFFVAGAFVIACVGALWSPNLSAFLVFSLGLVASAALLPLPAAPEKRGPSVRMRLVLTVFTLCLLLLGGAAPYRQELALALSPDEKAGYWSSQYDNLLVGELLSHVRALGEAELSDDEYARLIEQKYAAPELRAAVEDEALLGAVVKSYEEELQGLLDSFEWRRIEFLMPARYVPDYLLTYIALKTGALPALGVSAVFLALYVLLFCRSLRCKNPLARLLSCSFTLLLLGQIVIYFLANLGLRLDLPLSLPLLYAGRWTSLTNLFEFAVVMSCFRFDLAVREEFYCQKRKNAC